MAGATSGNLSELKAPTFKYTVQRKNSVFRSLENKWRKETKEGIT